MLCIASTVLGMLLLASACFTYARYSSSNMHAQERLEHAQILNVLWSVGLYGSMVLSFLSLFGLGRFRWIGLAVNASAFFFGLMILGAMCGPFGC